MTSPKEMPIQRSTRQRDMSSPAIRRPPIMASSRVAADKTKVICSPDIKKSRLFQTASQRKRYDVMAHLSRAQRARRLVQHPASHHGATIGSSLCFLAYCISRPSSLIVSTNRLLELSQIW